LQNSSFADRKPDSQSVGFSVNGTHLGLANLHVAHSKELAGLKWIDIDFLNLQIDVTRSVVDQHVGKCKTEISQKPVPIDEYIAADLQEWYRQTPYHAPTDWVFATDSNRAGEKRGKQPLWLSKVMGYHI
jgi:integrase